MRNIILLCLSSRESKNRQTLHKHQRKKSEKSNVGERRTNILIARKRAEMTSALSGYEPPAFKLR